MQSRYEQREVDASGCHSARASILPWGAADWPGLNEVMVVLLLLLGDSGERKLATEPDRDKAVLVGVIAPRRCSPSMDAPGASKGVLLSSVDGVPEGEYLRGMGMVGAPPA